MMRKGYFASLLKGTLLFFSLHASSTLSISSQVFERQVITVSGVIPSVREGVFLLLEKDPLWDVQIDCQSFLHHIQVQRSQVTTQLFYLEENECHQLISYYRSESWAEKCFFWTSKDWKASSCQKNH
jgi:hypothetical protein